MTHKLQEKPSAFQREHPALQNIKILHFFSIFVGHFALLDPDTDPATQINADPDPQPWILIRKTDAHMQLLSLSRRPM